MVKKFVNSYSKNFVKTCRELNHWLEMRPQRYAQYHPDKPGKLGLRPCDCKWKGLRSFCLIKTLVSGDYQKWSDSTFQWYFFLLFWCHCPPLCVTLSLLILNWNPVMFEGCCFLHYYRLYVELSFLCTTYIIK